MDNGIMGVMEGIKMPSSKKVFTPDMKPTIEEYVIEDIIVIDGGKNKNIAVPSGYEKIDVDLNMGAGGHFIFFCIKRGTDKSNAIVDLQVVAGGNGNVAAPAGFEKVNVDLNAKAGGKYIFLCKKRGASGAISDVKVIYDSKKITAPEAGWKMSPQDLNEGAGGKYMYLCWR